MAWNEEPKSIFRFNLIAFVCLQLKKRPPRFFFSYFLLHVICGIFIQFKLQKTSLKNIHMEKELAIFSGNLNLLI